MIEQKAVSEQKKKVNKPLRQARLKRLLNYQTVANLVGVSMTAYIRWETGKQKPHLVNLQALCNVFHMTPAELGFADLVTDNEIVPDPDKEAQYQRPGYSQ